MLQGELCLPLALVPRALRDGWQLGDAAVAAVQVLGRPPRDDPHQFLVVRFGTFWRGVFPHTLTYQTSPVRQVSLGDLQTDTAALDTSLHKDRAESQLYFGRQ